MSIAKVSNSSTIPFKLLGTKSSTVEYKERTAVRVVVKDADNQVVILKVQNGNYYKLPGGGVEPDESLIQAAEREVAEETGCRVSVESECIAMTEEYRFGLHQLSYCYRARLLDRTGKPALTQEEIEDGFSHEWISVEEVLRLMNTAEPTSELGQCIMERDLFLLTEALGENPGKAG
ncbi:hypothetical protein jhhlp_001212 [Lomentospora prolificans]|uniref:Nudix hydrolase domain-containing protein n=1 Tax=Lomentospora prolificans TaxID=41688 RepID=A0A2N3NHM3_9PEZI|nr:hypothetical protein jhhlp_001212 [Lomentospora prolificans]